MLVVNAKRPCSHAFAIVKPSNDAIAAWSRKDGINIDSQNGVLHSPTGQLRRPSYFDLPLHVRENRSRILILYVEYKFM